MKKYNFSDLILKETPDFYFVNKPHGIASLDERSGEGPSLIDLARQTGEDLQLCHRLDKDTSGVLLIARNAEAYRHASGCFAKRKAEKTYHAFVQGVHHFQDQRIEANLSKTRKGVAKIDLAEGKEAITIVNTLHAYRHYSLVECKPLTGRFHQIRIHMAFAHAPLVSDVTYGGKPFMLSDVKRKYNLKKFTEEQPLVQRAALHAVSLYLPSMNSNGKIGAEAPYPKDLRALERQLQLHDS